MPGECVVDVDRLAGLDVAQTFEYDVDGTPGVYKQPGGGVFFVTSGFDDDEDSKGWGYKTWSGFLYMVVFCNLIVWPAAWGLKQLPGVRSVM